MDDDFAARIEQIRQSHEYPSAEELMREQGTKPIVSIDDLAGDFWPEDESIDDFLEFLYEHRGHRRDPSAA